MLTLTRYSASYAVYDVCTGNLPAATRYLTAGYAPLYKISDAKQSIVLAPEILPAPNAGVTSWRVNGGAGGPPSDLYYQYPATGDLYSLCTGPQGNVPVPGGRFLDGAGNLPQNVWQPAFTVSTPPPAGGKLMPGTFASGVTVSSTMYGNRQGATDPLPINSHALNRTFAIVGQDTITVPAGTFANCWRVNYYEERYAAAFGGATDVPVDTPLPIYRTAWYLPETYGPLPVQEYIASFPRSYSGGVVVEGTYPTLYLRQLASAFAG